MYSLSCFGRPHAHHQELKNCSSSLWFYCWSVVLALTVVLCSWSGLPARPWTQHDCHHDTKVKPEVATAVIELLMMGGTTPETRWAVNKRRDNELEKCCIWLVIYLNCMMMHGLTNLKFLDTLLKHTQISNLKKIHSGGDEFLRADGLTDMTKLIVAFRNFANVPKNVCVLFPSYQWLLNMYPPTWWYYKYMSCAFKYIYIYMYTHTQFPAFPYFLQRNNSYNFWSDPPQHIGHLKPTDSLTIYI
jgi:hypothetical protein